MVNTDRIASFCCDAYRPEQLDVALGGREFDFIVDDAVHDPLPQIALLHSLWPRLRPGGLFAMEDVCPYKLPYNDLQHMIRLFPAGSKTEVISTHKDERLLLISHA
jgi:predicted O-methyltransferase YrrM